MLHWRRRWRRKTGKSNERVTTFLHFSEKSRRTWRLSRWSESRLARNLLSLSRSKVFEAEREHYRTLRALTETPELRSTWWGLSAAAEAMSIIALLLSKLNEQIPLTSEGPLAKGVKIPQHKFDGHLLPRRSRTCSASSRCGHREI